MVTKTGDEKISDLQEWTVGGVETGHSQGEVQPGQGQLLGLWDPGEQPVEVLLTKVGPVQHQPCGLFLHGGGQQVRGHLLPGQVNNRPQGGVQADLVPGGTNPANKQIVTRDPPGLVTHRAALASSDVVRY